jgi:hypothetical protein
MAMSKPAAGRHRDAGRLSDFVAGFGSLHVVAELLLRQISGLKAATSGSPS